MAFLIIAIFIAGFLSGTYVWGTGSYTTISSSGVNAPGWMNASSFKFNDEFWFGSCNRTDVFANPQMPYSYEISIENGVVKAKNGSTGQIEFQSTNANYVIQSAIDATPVGGKVFIKAGKYDLDNKLTIEKAIVLEGEGIGGFTELSCLRFTDGVDGIIVSASATTVCIKNLYLKTGGKTKTGIYLQGNATTYLKNCRLENIRFHGWNIAVRLDYSRTTLLHGLDIRSSITGIYTYGLAVANMISNCHMWGDLDADSFGVRLVPDGTTGFDGLMVINSLFGGIEKAVYGDYGSALQIANCQLDGWTITGLRLANTKNIVITGNWIQHKVDSTNSTAIRLNTCNAINIIGNRLGAYYYNILLLSCDNASVIGNVCKLAEYYSDIEIDDSTNILVLANECLSQPTGAAHPNSIREIGTADNNVIMSNRVALGISRVGAHTVVRHNFGFVTENSGTISAVNGTWVEHGLAGTPTTIIVTPLNGTYDGVPVIANVLSYNATMFQVGLYWTNGTAITTPLLVSYYVEYKP